MTDPRIVFVGSVDFSAHCLRVLLGTSADVVAVITPTLNHARINADYADLAPIAVSRGIAVRHIAKINDPSVVTFIRECAPDAIFVCGFSQLIGASILEIPKHGVIGTHPTLLPEGRGRHPLIWAIIKGLKRSGLSFFLMDEGADTGDIVWQEPFEIGLDDDAAGLYAKMKDLAAKALPALVSDLADGRLSRHPQDPLRATVWPKRGEKDGEIDWATPSLQIYNLIRALSRPYVGAHAFLGGQRVTIWKSRMIDGKSAESAPGIVLSASGEGPIVKTGDGALELTEISGVARSAIVPGMAFERMAA